MGSGIFLEEKIGETLKRFSLMNERQVKNILIRQDCGDRRLFGEIAVDLRYIDQSVLETYLTLRHMPLWSGQSYSDDMVPEVIKEDSGSAVG